MFINAISCNCKKFEHTTSFVYKKTLGIPRMSAVLGARYNHGVNHLKGYVFLRYQRRFQCISCKLFVLKKRRQKIIVVHNETPDYIIDTSRYFSSIFNFSFKFHVKHFNISF